MSVLSSNRAALFAMGFAWASSSMASELTVQEAADRVQRESNAKVLSVQTLQVGKRKIYRIKVLTPGGQVRVVEVKANE